jgi:hypothetical protein
VSCRGIRSTLMRKATFFTIGFRLYGCRSSEYPTGRVHIASCPDRIGPPVPSVEVVHPVLVVWHNQQTYAVSQSGPVGLGQNAVVGRASRPCLVMPLPSLHADQQQWRCWGRCGEGSAKGAFADEAPVSRNSRNALRIALPWKCGAAMWPYWLVPQSRIDFHHNSRIG